MAEKNVAVSGGRRLSPPKIADVLRDRIRTGALRAGDRLPTQAELADEFGVERGAVRQALRELQDDGLLSNVSRGSPPRIAESRPEQDGPQPAMVSLAPRLVEAFAAPHVRIDVLCLTAETLMVALGEPVRQIHEGRLHPQSVHVRVLLPSRDIDLAFPVLVDGRDDDDSVHERWLSMRDAQARVLRHNLRSLRATHGTDVRVTFRALPFTPPVKLYLLNDEEALLAYYLLTRREETVEDERLEMYDVLGLQSLLFPFSRGAGGRDAAFVEESRKWFDALWDTITSDLVLD